VSPSALVGDARRRGPGDVPLFGLVGRGHELDLRARQPKLLGYITPAGRRTLHLADKGARGSGREAEMTAYLQCQVDAGGGVFRAASSSHPTARRAHGPIASPL